MKAVIGKSGVRYICTNKECGHSESIEESNVPQVILKNKENQKS